MALILVPQVNLPVRPRIALGLEPSRQSKPSTGTTAQCTLATVWIVQLKGACALELMGSSGRTILLLTCGTSMVFPMILCYQGIRLLGLGSSMLVGRLLSCIFAWWDSSLITFVVIPWVYSISSLRYPHAHSYPPQLPSTFESLCHLISYILPHLFVSKDQHSFPPPLLLSSVTRSSMLFSKNL